MTIGLRYIQDMLNVFAFSKFCRRSKTSYRAAKQCAPADGITAVQQGHTAGEVTWRMCLKRAPETASLLFTALSRQRHRTGLQASTMDDINNWSTQRNMSNDSIVNVGATL